VLTGLWILTAVMGLVIILTNDQDR